MIAQAGWEMFRAGSTTELKDTTCTQRSVYPMSEQSEVSGLTFCEVVHVCTGVHVLC